MTSTDPSAVTHIYKLIPPSSAPPTELPERLPLSELDATDGFIHLSTSVQLPRTLNRFFANESKVFILRIVYDNVKEFIRWEDPKGKNPGEVGAENVFPHLYNGGRLGSEEIESVKVVEKTETGWDQALESLDGWLVY